MLTDDNDENEAFSCTINDSLYYTESELVDMIRNRDIRNSHNLTILSINIANLLTKLRSLKLFIGNISTPNNRPDIIIVVETHITKLSNLGYTESELKTILPGYVFFHKGRTTMKGGGVGIFISELISSKAMILEKIEFVDQYFESLVVHIPNIVSTPKNCSKRDLTVAAIYRQPNGQNYDRFISELEKFLTLTDKRNNEVILAGDFNLDLLKYDNHLPTANYYDLITNHKFIPRIVRPTRIKKLSATLIDHIFSRDGKHMISGIIDTEIAGNSGYTDHFPVFTILNNDLEKNPKRESFTKSFFTEQGHQLRKNGLRQENWHDVFEQDDPNVIYDMIQTKYGFHYNKNLTTRTFKKNSNRHYREPWMNSELLADIRRRDRLAKQKHRREDYKKLRNAIVSKIRKAEKEYVSRQIAESSGNIKKHWKIIKKATNKLSNKEPSLRTR